MTLEALNAQFQDALGAYFPSLAARLKEGDDIYQAVARGLRALSQGSLSWAQFNQILHRCSQAGMSEGFFRYYFLEVPDQHPYPVDRVFATESFRPPEGATEILSIKQLQWGVCRFMHDAMLHWGNFRQAYRELRERSLEDLQKLFASKRFDEKRMIRRGKVEEPMQIPRDHRYLISEMACKTYSAASLQDTQHVKLVLEAFPGAPLRLDHSEG